MKRAVFLDRDGVLNRCIPRTHTPYGSPRSLDELVLLPRVKEAINLLKKLGLLVVVVTNQPEIARGLLRQEELDAIHTSLQVSLPLDDIFVCPHDDGADCACRKPKTGMLTSAARKWDIDLGRSFMVGDRWRDMEAGRAAGCTTLLVGQPDVDVRCDYAVADLHDAAVKIAEQVGLERAEGATRSA